MLLGTRIKNGRKVFMYLLPNRFVEIIFQNDSTESAAEALTVMEGLGGLNDYLEKEFKTNF